MHDADRADVNIQVVEGMLQTKLKNLNYLIEHPS